jgi:hypothetical protein
MARPAMHDAETVRLVRRWYAIWRQLPKPKEVAHRLGMNQSALGQMARGETYKWVR